MRVSITKSIRGLTLCAAVLAVVLALAPAVADQPPKASITEADVRDAQRAWCNGLLRIGEVYRAGGTAYRAVASRFIDDLYDYNEGKVFFKPTLAFGPRTFRPTKEGALSYFIGGNPAFPEDEGFAVKNHWVKADYDNPNGIQIHGDIAITMGNVYLIDNNHVKLTVDKTFVFRKGRDGKLRLCVHHSSLPAKPGKTHGS